MERRLGSFSEPSTRKCYPACDEQVSSEERLARTLAEQSALALANLKMREVLKTQSIRDPLIGLFNRRYMEESFGRELRRAARTTR